MPRTVLRAKLPNAPARARMCRVCTNAARVGDSLCVTCLGYKATAQGGHTR